MPRPEATGAARQPRVAGGARRLASLVTRAAVVVMRLAVRVVPTARIAVVHGFPDTEENSLRIAAELRRTLPEPWRVVLLCDDPAITARAHRALQPTAPPVTLRRRLGPVGYLTAVIARIWVHTHGLYGSPRGGRGRCHVLVGHGHGPKQAVPYGVAHRPQHADLAFTNTRVWGSTVIDDLGVPATAPRVVLASPRSDPGRPVTGDPLVLARTLLWLPTVRRTRAMLRGQWQDGTPVTDQHGLVEELSRLCAAAHRRGLRVATKVHALDADAAAFDQLGVRVLTSDELLATGIGFHQLVGSAAGLLTDYSSVFVDHLHTALPIAFWTPDVAEFARDRGFNEPDFRTVAPELFLRDRSAVDEFLDAVAAGTPWRSQARTALATAIGLAPVDPAGGATRAVVRRILAQAGVTAVAASD